jgi:hypothetical protein
MEFAQSTLDEIIESEGKMPLLARERYGQFYTNAVACSVLLSTCVVEFDHTRMMFGRFLALTKKHHMLAVLSTVRLHRAQAAMNLRQVLEAGAAAAFAIANPEVRHFAEMDDQGILVLPRKLADNRYKWLSQNYPEKSEWIKAAKTRINGNAAHASVLSSDGVFRVGEGETVANTPFFDIEDDYFVKTDLWEAAAVALELMDLFYGVNIGRELIAFRPDFLPLIRPLVQQTDALLDQQRSSERFKRVAIKLDARK